MNQSPTLTMKTTPQHYVEQDQLLVLYSPYDQLEQHLLEHLIPYAALSHEQLRAATASAIRMSGHARSISIRFSLRQVFQRYPIQTPEGQTLFQLINQLCHLSDKNAQKAFIQECFSAATWMQDPKRRDQFFSATSSWGLSIANRFFSTHPLLGSSHSDTKDTSTIAQKIARKLSSPMMHKTIIQAVHRLTDPLIFSKDWRQAMESAKGTALYLRPAFPYARTLQTAEDNTTKYKEILKGIHHYCQHHAVEKKPQLHVELHHFSGPIDIRQNHRLHHLFQCLSPIADSAATHNIQIIVGTTQSYALPLLRTLFNKIVQHILKYKALPNKACSPIGLQLSAAEPSSFTTLQWLSRLAQSQDIMIPVRLTKERTKPSLFHSSAIHVAYLALAKLAVRQDSGIIPLFVSHNPFTLACIQHLTQHLPQDRASSYEIHHRCGIGSRCTIAFQDEFNPQSIRLEAPLGNTKDHHHMILQRLREISDPQAFLNKLYDENTTTAELVSHPTVSLKKLQFPQVDFWRGQFIHPHQPALSLTKHSNPHKRVKAIEVHTFLSNDTDQKTSQSMTIAAHEYRLQQLKVAHQHAIVYAPLWIKLLVHSMDIPRYSAELQVEAALRQQASVVNTSIITAHPTTSLFPKGQIIWIGSGHRPLSPLLGQMTLALLKGNHILIKPASPTIELITQVLEPFRQAGFSEQECMSLPMSHDELHSFLQKTTSVDTVIFDGSQAHGKSLAQSLLHNSKQPPIPFWTTPASSCLSAQGMCLVDETASDQELHLLAADAWTLGPMIILATPHIVPQLQQALEHWRAQLIIGDAENRDTHLTQSQILQPFPFAVAPICAALGIGEPISISAPHQASPYFQIILFEEDTLLPLLQTLAHNAQLNRCTLLTRMPQRIKRILHNLPAHEIHLGWPKGHTSFVYQGLESNAFQTVSHILRHHRLHPWMDNHGTFDIINI